MPAEETTHALRGRLKDVYERKGLVLALGAGVSQASGLPGWEQLIENLGGRLRQGREPSVFKTLKAAGYSLPVIASVIEAAYADRGEDFAEAIQEQLYAKFRREIGGGGAKAFLRHVGRNKTLRAVAALCAIREEGDGGAGYKRNPRLHAIVTTNVDSVLRSYVRKRYRPSSPFTPNLVRSIERPSAGSFYDRIPIYYLHGFIRFDKEVAEVSKHAADLRVFTEQEFFDFFNNPHGLFNYTFLYLLREHPCLFLGMSLKDDNIRRLLHYSKKERFESKLRELLGLSEEKQNEELYWHFRSLPADEAERKQMLARLADDDSRRHFFVDRFPRRKGGGRNVRLIGLVETSLRRLGVNVIWVDEFSDIPKLFREFYEAPEAVRSTWADVYNLKARKPAPAARSLPA